jgi:hypothetical protein
VIALLSVKDRAYVHEAAKRGVFAYTVHGSPEELQSAIDITLQRFGELLPPLAQPARTSGRRCRSTLSRRPSAIVGLAAPQRSAQ